MLCGQSITCLCGESDDEILDFDVEDNGDGTGARVLVRPASGDGENWCHIVCDGKHYPAKWIAEGGSAEFSVSYDPALSTHIVSVFLCDFEDLEDVDPAEQQRDFTEDKGKALQIDITPAYESLKAYPKSASDQLSNWSLTGISRVSNTRPGDGPTERRLDVELVKSGTTRTVTLSVNGLPVASGYRTGDGTINLTELNASGISGSVDVVWAADIALGDAFVGIRWPASYEIHIAPEADWPLTFPRTAEKTVYDLGLSDTFAAVVDDLDSDTYKYLVRAVSNTQTTGTNTSSLETIPVPGRPAAPDSDITLQATPGNNTNTKIKFSESPTASVTYRYFDSILDGPTDMLNEITPTDESISAGVVYVTLPSIGSGTGKRRVVAVAVNGSGVQDAEQKSITIEYVSGTIVLPRPNVPGFTVKSRNGRAVTLDWVYPRMREQGAGDDVIARLYDAGGTLIATASPASISSDLPVAVGTISVTASANGWHTVVVNARASGTESVNTARSDPFWLSNAAPSAPSAAAHVVG